MDVFFKILDIFSLVFLEVDPLALILYFGGMLEVKSTLTVGVVKPF